MKKNKILVALLILFAIGIAVVGVTVSKAKTTERTITQNMSPGQTINIPKTGWTFDGGSVVECDTTTLTNIAVEETSSHYIFKYDGSGSGSEKVVCTETAGNGTVHVNTISFKFKTGATMTIRGAQSDELDSNGDIMKQYGFIKYITGSTVESGGEFINLDCNPGSYCHVRASSQAYDGNEHTAVVVIKYQDKNGNEASLRIEILVDVWGSARFYPGSYAYQDGGEEKVTCNFDPSQWTRYERGTYSGNTMFYYPKTDGAVSIPMCGDGSIVDTNGLPIRFAGWVKSNISLHVKQQGQCSSGEFGEYLGMYGTINGTDKGNYHSCYEFEPMVRISTGGAKLNDSSWIATRTAFDGVESHVYYKTAESASQTITLPSSLEYEFSLSSRKKITAWVKSTGERIDIESGNLAVPADGSVYYAVYDYTITGTNRSVYAKSSDRITLSGYKITGCTTDASSDILVAQFILDECIITGVNASEGPVTVYVTIEGQESPAEYKVTVLPDYGEFGEGFIFDPYVQDEGLFQENTGKNGLKIGANECESFTGMHLCNYGSSGAIQGSSIQSSAYAAQCNKTGETFVTICLDPGAAAPSGEYKKDPSGIAIPGIRSMVELLKEDISNGVINTSDFTSANCGNSAVRDGVNSAFRTAMIHVGFSYYSSLSSYQRYSAAAGLMPNVDAAVASIFDLDSSCSTTACQTCKRYLEAFNNVSESEENKWELSKETDLGSIDGNSYTVIYKGEIKGPEGLTLDTSHVTPGNCEKFHYSCEMEFTGEVQHDAENGVNIYPFVATMTVPDASLLDVPSTDAEKAEASFRISIQGGKLADVFLLAPANGANMQRLLTFDLDTDGIMVYLSPAPPSCLSLDVTSFEACNGPNWETECNAELFAEAGCCSLINDEEKWENIFNNICSNTCAQNTVGQVCEFVPNSPNGNAQTSELYHIHEGYKFNADSGEYEEDLGQCIVKTDVKYNAETKSQASLLPATDVEGNFDKFTTYDSRENLMNSQEYTGNRYCQVICKEDWDISMGSFGNFMGNEAVVAGSYFAINQADIFIKGQRSCYTTFLYPKQYITDMRTYAEDLIKGYNDYSNVAHSMTAFDFESPRVQGTDSFTYYKYKEGTSKNSTYDEPKSAKVKICRNYEDVKVTKTSCSTRTVSCGKDGKSKCCQEYNCTTTTWTSADECTVSTTASEHFGCTDSPHTPFTDMEYELPHIEWFQISAKYNDGHAGAGKYEKYEIKTDGVGSKTNTDYDQWRDTLTCTATKNGKRDDVYCSGTYTPSFQALKASEYTKDTATSELDKKVDERIIGKRTNNLDQDSGEEGLGVHGYYDAVKQKLKADYDAAVAAIRVAQGNLQSAANQWYKCEYFGVYTSNYQGDDELAKGSLSPVMKAIGTTGTPGMIGTEYDPIVTYSYDERNYMNILANEKNDITGHVGANMLIPYVDKNGYVMGESAGLGTTHTPTEIKIGVSSIDETGIHYTVDNNFIDYSYKEKEMYNAGGYDGTPWTTGSENTKKYTGTSGSGSVETKPVTFCMIGDWTANDKGNSMASGGTPFTPLEKANEHGWEKAKGGHCYTSNVEYLGDVNYIKKSVSNSAYYRNKGKWYSGVNGTVAHGDDPEKALINLKELSGVDYSEYIDQWGSIGNLNVFPVAMTTPRNLYVYTYLFANIGSYLDGQAGRLMGDDDSVFQNNTRSCFYEVIETICHCCGDPIEYHTVDSKGVEAEIRENYAKDHGMSNKTSDTDKIKASKKGQIGFYNTVSSLNNLSALNEEGNDRTLAANWGDQSIFNYNGYNRYVTNKGDIAAKAIEAVGEEIYSGTGDYQAEYAYRLTPDAISTIRTYNLENSYGIDYKKMESYGQVLFVAEEGNYVVENMADHINFNHYGSKFLETTMVPYVKTDNNMNLVENNKVCYIKESELSYNESNPSTYKNLSNAINNQIKSGCRWVDYIEEVNTNPNGGGLDDGPFRLAFK